MAWRSRAARGGQSVEFFGGLSQSRLLALYLAAAVAASLYLAAVGYGSRFFVATVGNLALLGLYVAVINLTTRKSAARPAPVARPRGETLLLVFYLLLLLVRASEQVPEMDLTGLVPAYRQIDAAIVDAARALTRPFWPGGAPAGLFEAASNLFWLLLVPLGIFLALGYRPAALGLVVNYWWVALPLLALAALLAYGAGRLMPAGGVMALLGDYVASFFTAGLAQEFFFRGLLLPRLEAWRGRSLDALAIAAWLASAAQIPAFLATDGFDLTLVAAKVLLAGGGPIGLASGYLYLRTRSLAPCALWHASPWLAFPLAP